MKERPILFSGEMVRALLAGTKTQTRRIVKPQGSILTDDLARALGVRPPAKENSPVIACPFGQPGDRLWVREQHHITLRDARAVAVRYSDGTLCKEITIGAREFGLFCARKKPKAITQGRFMWRCLSRLTLEIVSVRVERLHAITEAAAKAEGIDSKRYASGRTLYKNYVDGDDFTIGFSAAIDSYRTLWEKLNGAGSWDLNPWVWVVEFRRISL
jgi:hypothetical protein